MINQGNIYKGYRYPPEIISYAVWLYHRFMLSLRDVSEILLQRGVIVSYESIREWGIKFGPKFAKQLRRREPRLGDKWHLDEVCLVINKKKYWLWRAVDQEGYELDILLQTSRNKRAARRFFQEITEGFALYTTCYDHG